MNPIAFRTSLIAAASFLLLSMAISVRLFSAEGISSLQIPAVLLIKPRESTAVDQQIIAVQQKLARNVQPGPELERLGWLLVAKARTSSDPGFYTLAGIAADVLEKNFGWENEALLLRGHVLQTKHRFAEAEAIARRLVAARGYAADYALLGDALYDRGNADGAAEAYQKLVDLRPGLDAYARAANIRWLKGDLDGAVTLQALAVRSGSPNDAGALAWSLVRLGQLVWARGNAGEAAVHAARACELVPDFPPALILQGRILLATGRSQESLDPLLRATKILPLPESRWVYAEALRASGREAEAKAVETVLVREGVAEDPRTVALFLATREIDPDTSVRLAANELATRADVMTHAVNALALAQAGRNGETVAQVRAALAEGTVDAHLFLQAGRALALAGQPEAVDLLTRARQLAGILLPSELRQLDQTLARLSAGVSPRVAVSTKPNPHYDEIHL